MSIICVSIERQRLLVSHFRQTNGCIVSSFQSECIVDSIGKNESEMLVDPSWKLASTMRQRFLVLNLGWSKGEATPSTHDHNIGRLDGQKWNRPYRYHLLKMNVNGASSIFGLAWWTLKALCIDGDPYSMYRPPWWAKMWVTRQRPPPKNEHQLSVTDVWFCIFHTPRAIEQCCPIISLSAAVMGKNASDNTATTSLKSASTEGQQCLVLHLGQCRGYVTLLSPIQLISGHYGEKWKQQSRYHLLKISVNGASTISGLASCTL